MKIVSFWFDWYKLPFASMILRALSFERKVGKQPLKIVSFPVIIQIKINEREVWFTEISLSIVLRECLIKARLESVMRTHLIFVSTITTASGVKQHNTTVYFMNLFKIFIQDKELWISFCVRLRASPKILSLNTFSSTTWMYTSDRG